MDPTGRGKGGYGMAGAEVVGVGVNKCCHHVLYLKSVHRQVTSKICHL